MKVHYTLLCLCILSILGQKTFGQSLYKVSEEEKVLNSTLIIEGKVLSRKSFWNDAHTMIYTSNKVEVYKIFKGNTRQTEIEIITIGGTVERNNITTNELLELSIGDAGVFYCYPNRQQLRSPSGNNLLYTVWGSSQGFIKYDPVTLSANAPFVRINNIENDLYKGLQEKTGRSYTTIKAFKPSETQGMNKIEAVGITSFSPTTVNAGATLDPANNVLTITGTGFGTANGMAAVFFDDANDGSGGNMWSVAYDDPLMVSWSSTSIVVKVPSRAGTGNIIVRDDAGLTGASPLALTVNYSILTASFTDGVTVVTKESNLMNTNVSGGYTLLYSTSASGNGVDFNTAPEKATFQRALTTWKELTGLNFTEGGTTTNQAVSDDGVNTIMFDNDNTGVGPLAAGVLGVCYSYNFMCDLPDEIQKTGFDIIVRNPAVSLGSTSFTVGPCPPRSSSFSEIDLETVLLHELGHALNLGHINDTYQGSSLPQINPGKLMNYAVVNGVKRSSPDYSAYAGALYATTPQGNSYGGPCGLYSSEMSLLSTTTESKDECPSFPSSPLADGTVVAFDLVHATSNKFTDPQYTALNCSGTGTGVTNTAFYALKTSPAGSGSLLLTVSGYSTTPVAQALCTPTAARGVELALYSVSSCPAGQSFPAPVACRTFNGDGALTAISGLSTNATYLLVVDGIENTKATFNLTFGGSALPVNLLSFTGEKKNNMSLLKWETENEFNNDRFEIETSKDGISFYKIGIVKSKGTSSSPQQYDFTDILPAKNKNYYRLKQVDIDGKFIYSKIVSVDFEETTKPLIVYPNPVKDKLTIDFAKPANNVTIEIFTIDGKQVKKITSGAIQRTTTIDLSDITNGTYMMQINTGSGIHTFKLMKQ